MMIILLLLLVGLGIGVISATLGIGGGVLLVPVLTWMFDYDYKQAAGITLAVLAVPVALPAVWQYYARDVIRNEHLVTAGWIALGFAVGGLGGAWLVHHLDVALLRMLFGLVLIYIAVRFLAASDQEFAAAVIGLVAVTVAWLGYVGLRLLGRRARRPALGDAIRAVTAPGPDVGDYYI